MYQGMSNFARHCQAQKSPCHSKLYYSICMVHLWRERWMGSNIFSLRYFSCKVPFSWTIPGSRLPDQTILLPPGFRIQFLNYIDSGWPFQRHNSGVKVKGNNQKEKPALIAQFHPMSISDVLGIQYIVSVTCGFDPRFLKLMKPRPVLAWSSIPMCSQEFFPQKKCFLH